VDLATELLKYFVSVMLFELGESVEELLELESVFQIPKYFIVTSNQITWKGGWLGGKHKSVQCNNNNIISSNNIIIRVMELSSLPAIASIIIIYVLMTPIRQFSYTIGHSSNFMLITHTIE
jgi:hypothetical protein